MTALAAALLTLPTACGGDPTRPPTRAGVASGGPVTAADPAVPAAVDTVDTAAAGNRGDQRRSGDVDGDGVADPVTLSGDGTLIVRLSGTDRPVSVDERGGARLLGLADLGEDVLAVVVAGGGGGGQARAYGLRDGALARFRTADRAWLGASRSQAVWVDGQHRLLTGAIGSPGARRTAVYAQRWLLDPIRLEPAPAGELCWDRRVDTVPQRCAPGMGYGPRVGSHGDLPALFPAAEGSVGIGEPLALPDHATATLRGHARPELRAGDVRLVVGHGSSTVAAPVPAGWSPSLLTQGLDGSGGTGLVVSQEGGDSDTWTVFVRQATGLVRATTGGDVPLGGGFTSDGRHAYLSWLTPEGRLFTRVGLDREHHFRVHEWTLDGTVLHAHDLGEVCLDLQAEPPAYGRC